jgi:uncharacterized protein (DUF433 family)
LKKVLLNEHLFVTRVSEVFKEDGLFLFGKRLKCAPMETKRFNFPDTVPLVQLETGGVRVRNSRVTLEAIVHRMQMGDTAGQINDSFPTVSVTQIKEILAWYFDNKAKADEYLQQVEEEGERLRQWIESQPGYKERHEKLLRCREELRRRKAQLSRA